MDRHPPTLQVVFPRPGFFITDTKLEVIFDGVVIYEGTFQEGFERTLNVTTGQHQLSVKIALGAILRKKDYTFVIDDAPAYVATLRYSRFWGNFTGKLLLSRRG